MVATDSLTFHLGSWCPASSRSGEEAPEIGNLLSGIVVDAGAVTGMTINFESVNEDSAKILDEAQTIAESRMKDTFPELPGGQSKVGAGLGDRV